MARHAKSRISIRKKALAASGIFAAAAAPLTLWPIAGQATDACTDIVSGESNAVANLLSNDVCQIVFNGDVPSVVIPDWVTKLSVVAVGGGAGANGAYAGGGGQFVSLDQVSLASGRTFAVAVGGGGTGTATYANPSTGGDTTLDASGVNLLTALGAQEDALSYAADYSGGQSVTRYWSWGGDNPAISGAGTGGESVANGADLVGTRGPGVTIASVIASNLLDSDLWAEDLNSLFGIEFGIGGLVAADGANVAGAANTGEGGQYSDDKLNQTNGGSGILIMRFSLVQAAATAPAPYTGPLLQEFSSRTLDVCTPKSITITGTRLSGVAASVQGKPVTILENTDTKLVLAFPAGLTPGNGVDLVINSSSGTLTHQDAFDIPSGVCETELSKGRWTQLQSDGTTVKIYAKDPIGDGKIQFFVDGKEVAWINAIDESDPKLSFASSSPYLVRSVELKPGKNRFEIKLDGERVWRATYVLKG